MLRGLGFAGLIIVALVGLDFYVRAQTPYPESIEIGRGVSSFKELSDRFEALAQDKGALYAFEVLKRAPLPPTTDLHLLGHVVGDELYKQQGIAGMAYCTQDFRNACSHTIVIGALTEYGASDKTLQLIDDACHSAPGGLGAYTMCYHGLGHGVFAYYGYELPPTVELCKKMGTEEYNNEQYHQCVGGVVMELLSGGGHDPELWQQAQDRYLSASHPLAPCDTDLIPEEAKTFCYMYVTPQLLQLAGADLSDPDPQTFPLAFSYCDAIPTSAAGNRDACFGGFGKEFLPLVALRDIRALDTMSTDQYALAASYCYSTPIEMGIRACVKQQIETLLWGGENDPHGGLRFCTVVPPPNDDVCYQTLIENLYRYLPDTASTLCSELPKAYQERCATYTKS